MLTLVNICTLATTEWVDIDTAPEYYQAYSEHDGSLLQLVFSDEFARDGREFLDAHDSRWTSLQLAPTTNLQVNYYNRSLAHTEAGNLVLTTTNQDVTFSDGRGGTETRHIQTAMLQSWNKFCFTEGAVELRAKMPGLYNQEGLWPAFWLMGNMGRATFERSTDGTWPWIFDECIEPESPDCAANQCTAQKISACDAEPGFGLNPRQGRGAPEIDIVEVQPGKYNNPYTAQPGCDGFPTPDAAIVEAVAMQQPFVSTSLQAAPGFPSVVDQRPHKGCEQRGP